MHDLTEILIKQYRGLINLELKNLNKINIFVGPNNCGKTSILEAISLGIPYSRSNNKNLLDVLISRYHGVNLEAFQSIFPLETPKKNEINVLLTLNETEEKSIETKITSKENMNIDNLGRSSNLFNLNFMYTTYIKKTENDIDAAKQYTFSSFAQFKAIENDIISKNDLVSLELKENENGYSVSWKKQNTNKNKIIIPYSYLSFSRFDIAERLLDNIDVLLEKNQRKDLIEALQIFDNSIKNFEVIGKNRIIKLFSTKFDKPLSLYDYGNGMYKAFFIITATLLSKNGILLIDEIEAGIHTKALTRFMTKLLSVCKINNVQLFMTTHSLEAIDTILYDCQYDNCIDDIAIYHIKNTEKKTDVKRYNGEKMKRLRDNIGFDVR